VIADVLGGIDLRAYRRSEPAVLDDPAFERAPTGSLAERLDRLPSPSGRVVVYVPGSACVPHDELWYVDLPTRLHRSKDPRRMQLRRLAAGGTAPAGVAAAHRLVRVELHASLA
jgi:hypothetical protein